MCQCEEFRAASVKETWLRKVVFCKCGHSQLAHSIGLFKERCTGESV